MRRLVPVSDAVADSAGNPLNAAGDQARGLPVAGDAGPCPGPGEGRRLRNRSRGSVRHGHGARAAVWTDAKGLRRVSHPCRQPRESPARPGLRTARSRWNGRLRTGSSAQNDVESGCWAVCDRLWPDEVPSTDGGRPTAAPCRWRCHREAVLPGTGSRGSRGRTWDRSRWRRRRRA